MALYRLWTAVVLLCLSAAGAAAQQEITLADILPRDTLIYYSSSDPEAHSEGYQHNVLKQVFEQPDVRAFLDDMLNQRQDFVRTVSEHSGLDPAHIESLFWGKNAFALIDIKPREDRSPEASFVWAIHLKTPPAEEDLFNAIRAVGKELKDHYIQATGESVPMKEIAWPEAPTGDHQVMLLASDTPVRFVLLGRTLIFYRAEKRELLDRMIRNYDNLLAAPSLAKSEFYRKVYAGSGAHEGMGFLYINTSRLLSLLNALQFPRLTALLRAFGFDGVLSLGIASGYHRKEDGGFHEGILQTMYLYAPHERRGILKTLSMKQGAEKAAMVLADGARGFVAGYSDLPLLYRELPVLVDASAKAIGLETPEALTALADRQTIGGVPAPEVLAPLGDAIVLDAGPAGWALRFDVADLEAFRSVIGRIERNMGRTFRSKTVPLPDGSTREIRYFNQWKYPVPLAPSYCVLGERGQGLAIIYVATHPQAIEGILREDRSRKLIRTEDYRRVLAGMGSGYVAYLYIDTAVSYDRVYDAMVPVANVMTAAPMFKADAGRLPPGDVVAEYMFGCGMGVKNSEEGITCIAYSPWGLGGFGVFVMDKMFVSSPSTVGVLAAELARFLGARPELIERGRSYIPEIGGR
jgi:hypothetical protein